jgi:RNA recognition motif-containing protein
MSGSVFGSVENPPHQTMTPVLFRVLGRGESTSGSKESMQLHEGGNLMAHKLFVGGLPFSTSEERLREVFAQAGKVESAVVVTDRGTGRSRGFGFVEMSTSEEADQAVAKLNGKDLDGRQLKVERANASDGGAGGARRGPGGGSRGGFGGGGGSRGGRW